MEDNKLNLHPGFRFNPFESELINLYLKPKVIGEKLSCNVIEERQLYGANPWQVFDPQNHPWILHEVSCGRFEKIAYAFVNLTKKAANPSDKKKSHVGREHYIRKVGCGTWDGQTKRTEIRDCDDNLIGERRMLVFEINEVSGKEEDLSWVGHWRMHEYHLCGVNKDIPNLSNTVLCKIILDHSKKPAIKLLPNKTTCPIKASAPEKNNKTKKTNTKKLDVVVRSSSSTNSAAVDTLEGISKSWGDFTTICHNDGLVSGPKGEEERCCDDDDLEDWINNLFVSEEEGNLYINMSEFKFPSYPEHEDEQPLVDVTGKRKLQPETSYVLDEEPKLLFQLRKIRRKYRSTMNLCVRNVGPAKKRQSCCCVISVIKGFICFVSGLFCLLFLRDLGFVLIVLFRFRPNPNENIFEWQFAIRGPTETEFEGGIYHRRIQLPSEYPFKPPSFMLLTLNGRFETQTKICLSISNHHPEHWQPSWSGTVHC